MAVRWTIRLVGIYANFVGQIDVSNIVNCVRGFIDTFKIYQQKKVCGFLEETEISNKRISSIDGEQKKTINYSTNDFFSWILCKFSLLRTRTFGKRTRSAVQQWTVIWEAFNRHLCWFDRFSMKNCDLNWNLRVFCHNWPYLVTKTILNYKKEY